MLSWVQDNNPRGTGTSTPTSIDREFLDSLDSISVEHPTPTGPRGTTTAITTPPSPQLRSHFQGTAQETQLAYIHNPATPCFNHQTLKEKENGLINSNERLARLRTPSRRACAQVPLARCTAQSLDADHADFGLHNYWCVFDVHPDPTDAAFADSLVCLSLPLACFFSF